MRVLSIDPGERVGWAVGLVTKTGHDLSPMLEVEAHGITALKDFALAFYQAIVVDQKYDAIVFETFRIRPNKAKAFIGSDLPTVQLIGMIRLCAWVTGTPLYQQGPDAKTSARMSMKNPGGEAIAQIVAKTDKVAHDDGHDGDALLHLWSFFFERFYA